jgi:hypothetical protein
MADQPTPPPSEADRPTGTPEPEPTSEQAAVEPTPAQQTPEPVAEEPAAETTPEPEAVAEEPAVEATPEPEPAAQQPAAAEATPEPAPEQAAAETTPELAPAPAVEQPAAAPEVAEAAPAESVPAGEQAPAPSGEAGAKPKRKRPRSRKPKREGDRRPPRQPRRQAGPLPINELRAAAQSIMEHQGSRRAVRDAFSVLADRERKEISQLVSDDGEWRIRARNISAGSLGAGRVGKALAAQQVSMASPEDIWPVTLSKEEAADRQSRVRSARQRDERRAQRDADRENRADRVSRADLAKAQDGRVGAQIRIVIEEPKGKRKKDKPERTEEPEQHRGSSVLDRLGY